MTWFKSLHRVDHPCNEPGGDEIQSHRVGEYWRCETCGDLWVLRGGGLIQVTDWKTLWRHRNRGYTGERS